MRTGELPSSLAKFFILGVISTFAVDFRSSAAGAPVKLKTTFSGGGAVTGGDVGVENTRGSAAPAGLTFSLFLLDKVPLSASNRFINAVLLCEFALALCVLFCPATAKERILLGVATEFVEALLLTCVIASICWL